MLRFSKDKDEGKIWLYIPSALILLWRGSRYERGLIALLVLITLLSVSYFWGLYSDKKERQQEYVSVPNPFADVELEAKVAYVFDTEKEKLLYGLHEEKAVPIASITKIMTALVALDILEEDSVISISKLALDEEGDNGLYWNEEWFLSDLVKFMLMSSSNDAAKAIALAAEEKLRDPDANIPSLDSPASPKTTSRGGPSKRGGQINTNDTNNFIERMNAKAEEFGLSKTIFLNETGLDISDTEAGLPAEAGAYGSAKDAALLLAHALKNYPEIFKTTAQRTVTFTSLSGFTHTIENTNPIVASVPGITSSKTGLTQLAGGNLVIVLQNGSEKPLILSILGSSEEGRFSDMEQLISAAVVLTRFQSTNLSE